MKALGRLLAAALLCLPVAACAADNGTRLETPVDGYPCGTAGMVCTDNAGKATGFCCGQEDVCGGTAFSGCPAEYCCDVGGDNVGAHLPRRQWRRSPTEETDTR